MWCLLFVTLTFCDFYVVCSYVSNSYVKWRLRYVMLRFVSVPIRDLTNSGFWYIVHQQLEVIEAHSWAAPAQGKRTVRKKNLNLSKYFLRC